ncbi:MAG: hypothetical protein QM621_12525 [Aeromicrobium sp.]|uniref:hypothetical protein n=1 Tax=Aeromicrobium sp. TaxID=1871063 RepID=UPI0039E6213D
MSLMNVMDTQTWISLISTVLAMVLAVGGAVAYLHRLIVVTSNEVRKEAKEDNRETRQALDHGLEQVNGRLDAMNTRIDDTNKRIDATNARIDDTNKRVDATRTELIERGEAMRTELVERINGLYVPAYQVKREA